MIELQTINRRSFTITKKATTRAFSWLKAPYGSTPGLAKCLNSVLNGKALEGAFSVIVQLHSQINSLQH